jgi:hypothetical protein
MVNGVRSEVHGKQVIGFMKKSMGSPIKEVVKRKSTPPTDIRDDREKLTFLSGNGSLGTEQIGERLKAEAWGEERRERRWKVGARE